MFFSFVSEFSGRRVGGELGVDSAKSMAVRSWFKYEIPKYTDSDPVSGNIQLSHMTIADAHTLFVIDMLDRGMPIDEVPLLPAFCAIWKSEFKNVTIRKYKTVDSKDQVRYTRYNFLLFLLLKLVAGAN